MRKSEDAGGGCEETQGSGVTLESLAAQYLCALEVRGLSRQTLRLRRTGVSRLVRFLAQRGRHQAHHVRPQDIDDFRVWMVCERPRLLGPWRGVHPRLKTALHSIETAKGFCRWMADTGVVLLDPAAGLESTRYVRGLPRVLSVSEVERLLATATGDGARAARDLAIVEVLYSCALRAGELLALDLGDLDLSAGEVLVRRGKGGRGRRVPVGRKAVGALAAYLGSAREGLHRGRGPLDREAVFVSATGERMKYPVLQQTLSRLVRRSGLPGRVTAHTLRHTAAVHLLKGGASVRHVQEFLGHASLETTAGYTRLDLEDLRDALVRSHPRSRMGV